MTRVAPSAILLRSLVVLSPLTAVGITWLAAGRVVPVVAVVVALLACACAARPASHLGVLVVAAVVAEWLAIVDDRTSPWSIGVAVGLTGFHAALAAATVAPPTAPWTMAMRRRWSRRVAALVVATGATWLLVVLADSVRPAASTALLVAALSVIAAGALWARNGDFRTRP